MWAPNGSTNDGTLQKIPYPFCSPTVPHGGVLVGVQVITHTYSHLLICRFLIGALGQSPYSHRPDTNIAKNAIQIKKDKGASAN